MGPKKQDFWPKINIVKGNHCILRIQGAPVRQKLGMILETLQTHPCNENREKPGFITGIPGNENRTFPVWKYCTGNSLFWPCTDPVRDCSE